MALGLEPGDEVITTPFTFIATIEVISLLKLKPVLIDVDEPVKEDQTKRDSSPKHQAVKRPKTDTERKPTSKWKIIWIVIGSLIAVLILILLIPPGEENSAIEFGRDGIVIRNTDSENIPKVTEKTGESEVQSTPEDDLTVEIEAKNEIDTAVPVVSANKYFIVAGSFQNLQNASVLLDQLKTKGFPAEIVYTENRLYRVAVKSFAIKTEAINELTKIKATPGLENAWVWTRN